MTIDFCGDPGSVVHKIHWHSWGGRQALGSGQGALQGSDGWTGGTATVVAFDLGTCDGKYMYEALEWYFPSADQRFNPSQYEDVCTGQTVDLSCLSYQQATKILQDSHQFAGKAAYQVLCFGSAWAESTIAPTTIGSTVLGSAAFHKTAAGWQLVGAAASQPDGTLVRADEIRFCRALVQAHAPADALCQS